MVDNISTVYLNNFNEVEWNDGSDDIAPIDFDVADEKFMLLLWNNGDNTEDGIEVTVEAGDMWQEGYGDIEVSLDQDEFYAAHFDSAVVKDKEGQLNIDIDATNYGDIQIAVVEQNYSAE